MTPAKVVRQMLDAFYSSGVAGARAFYDPEITWISRFPRDRVLRGPQGPERRSCPSRDRGPCVVVPGEMQIRERGSVRQTQVWWVIRVRDAKVLSGEDCLSREQLEAAVARCAEDA
jgi:hypothetical protein